jgi:hypothetical protein
MMEHQIHPRMIVLAQWIDLWLEIPGHALVLQVAPPMALSSEALAEDNE